jgi:hypothetical protein
VFSIETAVVRECDIKYWDGSFDIDSADAGAEDVEVTKEAENWAICCFCSGGIVSIALSYFLYIFLYSRFYFNFSITLYRHSLFDHPSSDGWKFLLTVHCPQTVFV